MATLDIVMILNNLWVRKEHEFAQKIKINKIQKNKKPKILLLVFYLRFNISQFN